MSDQTERLLTDLVSQSHTMNASLAEVRVLVELTAKQSAQNCRDVKSLKEDVGEMQTLVSKGRGAVWMLGALGGIALFFWAEGYRIIDKIKVLVSGSG